MPFNTEAKLAIATCTGAITTHLRDLATQAEQAIKGNGREYEGVVVELAQFAPDYPDAADFTGILVYPVWRGDTGGYKTLGTWPEKGHRALSDIFPENQQASADLDALSRRIIDLFEQMHQHLESVGSRSHVFLQGLCLNGDFSISLMRINSANCIIAQDPVTAGNISAAALMEISEILGSEQTPLQEMTSYHLKRPFRRSWDPALRSDPRVLTAVTHPEVLSPDAKRAQLIANVAIKSLNMCGMEIPPACGAEKFKVTK